jgi:hypothetical protein
LWRGRLAECETAPPKRREHLEGIAVLCLHLPGFAQQCAVVALHGEPVRAQRALDLAITPDGLRLVAAIPEDAFGAARARDRTQLVEAIPAGP